MDLVGGSGSAEHLNRIFDLNLRIEDFQKRRDHVTCAVDTMCAMNSDDADLVELFSHLNLFVDISGDACEPVLLGNGSTLASILEVVDVLTPLFSIVILLGVR